MNTEERCLSRPDAAFLPLPAPLSELPNLAGPVPAPLAVPKPCQPWGHPGDTASWRQRCGQEVFGSFAGGSSAPAPSPRPPSDAGLWEEEIREKGPGVGDDAAVAELLSATRRLCPEPRPGHRRRPVLAEPEQRRYGSPRGGVKMAGVLPARVTACFPSLSPRRRQGWMWLAGRREENAVTGTCPHTARWAKVSVPKFGLATHSQRTWGVGAGGTGGVFLLFVLVQSRDTWLVLCVLPQRGWRPSP